MRANYLLWLIALCVVNTGWYFVCQQSADQEINRPGADFSDSREAEISSLAGGEVDYEIEHCFKSTNGGVYNVSINVDMGSKTIYNWSGTTEDGCVVFSSSIEEGTVIVYTQIEEGVESTTSITTWPFRNAYLLGAIFFSIGTVILAFGESFVRHIVKQKLSAKTQNSEETATQQTVNDQIWQDPIRLN